MQILGEIALNCSLVLYLFLYLPQLIHNLAYKKMAHMSLAFHALLLIAATADFYYGFGRITQWQYQLVTVLMFSCLVFQHIHLFFYAKQFNHGVFYLSILSVIVIAMLLMLPIALHQHSTTLFITMGWIERISYWLYSVPQLIKNRRQKNAVAISPWFMGLAIFTALCDSMAAWSFAWGPSSLYGAPFSVVLHCVLLYQWFSLKQAKQEWSHACAS